MAGIHYDPKVDTLAVATFIELLCPIKCAIFQVNEGLQLISSSNMSLFETYFNKEGSFMQPIILTACVVSEDHIGKTAILACKGTFIKGKDTMLLG